MTGECGLTTDELERAGRHVLSVNDAVHGELTALCEQIIPLAGLWTGRAAGEFSRLMNRWDISARSLNEALSGIGELIGRVLPSGDEPDDGESDEPDGDEPDGDESGAESGGDEPTDDEQAGERFERIGMPNV